MNNTKKAKTKNSIKNSLIDLLHSKTLDRISIKELCEKAEIHRSTFYNHYGSQYDVFNDIKNTYCENLELYLVNDTSVEKNMYHVMEYISKNLEITKMVFEVNDGYKSIEETILRPHIKEFLKRFFSAEILHHETVIQFILAGSTGVILKWIENNCSTSVEEETAIILELVKSITDKFTN